MFIITNENGKLFTQLFRAMNHVDGSNNYMINRLDVEVKTNDIIIEGVCVNDMVQLTPTTINNSYQNMNCRISQ